MFRSVFGSSDCSWLILQQLNVKDVVSLARCNRLCFQAACNIQHLNVSRPDQHFPLKTLHHILQNADRLRQIKFRNFGSHPSNKKFLLSLPIFKNLQTISLNNCGLSLNDINVIFDRWEKTKSKLTRLTTIDIAFNDGFWDQEKSFFFDWENSIMKQDLDKLLGLMREVCPCLKTIRVNEPVFKSPSKDQLTKWIRDKHNFEMKWTLSNLKMFAINWNVFRVLNGFSSLRWSS